VEVPFSPLPSDYNGPLVNQPDARGITPFQLAIRLGDLSIAAYLLSRPLIDPCTSAVDLSTPFLDMCRVHITEENILEHLLLFDRLLSEQRVLMNLTAKDALGDSPFLASVRAGNWHAVMKLLSVAEALPGDVFSELMHSVDQLQNSCLHVAVISGDLVMLKVLLSRGAPTHLSNTEGTPAELARHLGRLEMCRLLLRSENPALATQRESKTKHSRLRHWKRVIVFNVSSPFSVKFASALVNQLSARHSSSSSSSSGYTVVAIGGNASALSSVESCKAAGVRLRTFTDSGTTSEQCCQLLDSVLSKLGAAVDAVVFFGSGSQHHGAFSACEAAKILPQCLEQALLKPSACVEHLLKPLNESRGKQVVFVTSNADDFCASGLTIQASLDAAITGYVNRLRQQQSRLCITQVSFNPALNLFDEVSKPNSPSSAVSKAAEDLVHCLHTQLNQRIRFV